MIINKFNEESKFIKKMKGKEEKTENIDKELNVYKLKNFIENIESIKFVNLIFSYLDEKIKLKIIKYKRKRIFLRSFNI